MTDGTLGLGIGLETAERGRNGMAGDAPTLLLGLLLAGAGGELFVRGAVGLAAWARVPAGIVGTTVAAFATSSPELSVSVSAALDGRPQIALGGALGSNVTNFALVLGLTAAISAVTTPRDSARRDTPVALIAPVVTGVLVIDGTLSRLDGALLLAGFAVWLSVTTVHAARERSAAPEVLGETSGWAAGLSAAAGLVCLIAAGRLIVGAASGIGDALGMDDFVVGATLVAAGTSTPELATALIATRRGHDEIGLGTLLGSNLFNGLFIVAVAALIAPITVPIGEVDADLAFGFAAVALGVVATRGTIGRRRGGLLLALYAAYVTVLIAFPPAPT